MVDKITVDSEGNAVAEDEDAEGAEPIRYAPDALENFFATRPSEAAPAVVEIGDQLARTAYLMDHLEDPLGRQYAAAALGNLLVLLNAGTVERLVMIQKTLGIRLDASGRLAAPSQALAAPVAPAASPEAPEAPSNVIPGPWKERT